MGKRGPKPTDPSARFWPKVDKDGPTPAHAPELGQCWLWTGAIGSDRRGVFGTPTTPAMRAHRFAYEDVVGLIPDGLELDHLCRNPPCVRPSHLEPVTHAENVRRYLATITHCPQGHEYTEANTYVRRNRHRQCRACSAEQQRALRRRTDRLCSIDGCDRPAGTSRGWCEMHRGRFRRTGDPTRVDSAAKRTN